MGGREKATAPPLSPSLSPGRRRLDLEVLEVDEGAADAVEDRQPRLGARRERRGRPRGAELLQRARALPRAREQAEVLAEAEGRGGALARGRLVAEEARHGVGRRLAEARARRDRVGRAAQREGGREVQRLGSALADDDRAARLVVVVQAQAVAALQRLLRRRRVELLLLVLLVLLLVARGQGERVGAREGRGGGRDGRGHLRRGGQLLEQADVDVELGLAGLQQRAQPDDARGLGVPQLGAHLDVVDARLLEVVHEVAARPVWAEADLVEGAAELGLVLGVAREVAQLAEAVGELALVAVLAAAALLEGPAELGLVARGGLADAAVELAVLLDEAHEAGVAAAQRGVPVAGAHAHLALRPHVLRFACAGALKQSNKQPP